HGISRHPRRALCLGRVRDRRLYHSLRRDTERVAVQFHVAARPALDFVRQFRDHDRARRDAQLLWTAYRRDNFRCRAGLPFQRDRQLDDVHRHDLRVYRAGVPQGYSRHLQPPRGGRMTTAVIREPAQATGLIPAPSAKTPFLRMENVSRHFGTLKAVDDVSFEMRAGDLNAVIGPNGAGKTTFFNLISGLLPPTAGRVVFEGENITQQTIVHRVAKGIVRTFQITEILPDLSVFENIRVGVETAAGLNSKPWIGRNERT